MINISFGYKQQAIIKFTWAHNAICAETERVKNTVSVIRRPLVCFMDLICYANAITLIYKPLRVQAPDGFVSNRVPLTPL